MSSNGAEIHAKQLAISYVFDLGIGNSNAILLMTTVAGVPPSHSSETHA